VSSPTVTGQEFLGEPNILDIPQHGGCGDPPSPCQLADAFASAKAPSCHQSPLNER
jgi:hypothetical protein